MKNREIQVDVVVVGGGMAGIASAVAAARNGAKVLLSDENGFFGGTATVSMLGELNGFTNNRQRIYGGVTAEIVDKMISQGFASLKYNVPMTGDLSVSVDRVRYNPEYLKIFLDEFVVKENINLLLHTTFDEIEDIDGTTYKLSFKNLYQKVDVYGSIVIDATGNASVAYKANIATHKTSIQNTQAVSLIFKMSGIDAEAYQGYSIDELRDVILSGYDKGFLPAKYCAINLIDGTNEAIINMTRVTGVDHENMKDLTKAELELRRQIKIAIPYLKKSLPGFENAYLSAIAPRMGIRDARRIKGRYTLTKEDVLRGRKFADTVAVGCYPIDIHGENHTVDFTPIDGDGIYTIPYSCLLPMEKSRLIAAGKCISADNGALAAIRVIPTTMAIGEAAGTAAALSVKHKLLPHDLDVDELQNILKTRGHMVGYPC